MEKEINSTNPKVTIITVSYNSASTIEDTIRSVINQDYENLEYIIIDGGSRDNTLEILGTYQGKIAKIVSEKDEGLYDAMNKGIKLSTGDIIGFLNSDDFYLNSGVISALVKEMLSKCTDSVFAELYFVEPQNTDKIVRHYRSPYWRPWMFRFGWMPAHPTFLVKSDCFKSFGLFSTELEISADFELLIRFLHKGKVSFTYLPLPVVKMRMGGISTRGILSSILLNREIVKACKRNGIWTCLPLVLLKVPLKLLEFKPSLFGSKPAGFPPS